MNYDQNPSKHFPGIKQLVLIDTDNDCDVFEKIFPSFPSLTTIHLDLNRLTFLSENFVNQIENLTYLSLSDNPTLKFWDPFINRLGKLQHLEELFLNNCGIDQIKLSDEQLFPSLKYLYMSDNQISSYTSINELSRLGSLISLSILRNPIYPINLIESETAKQMIIARLPNLVYLNRVLINREERRGAEIDYLQRYAQDYFDQKLDFVNEHTQYQKLIDRYGEPLKPNAGEVRF
jgi:Leucine-rich repeat (LRR) protein